MMPLRVPRRTRAQVKSLRLPGARIAPCDLRGKVLGEWVEANAYLVGEDAECKAAHAALVKQYGWQMRLLDCGSKLGGRYDSRAFIRIEPALGGKKRRP
jgi:hypothetical protein